jgi:sulfur-oxidizing protein SoxZ
MANPTPRVRVPKNAKKDELIEIKTLISHDMESGQRKGADGKVIPRKIIKKFTAEFNGKPVFSADWYSSISANPYQSFYWKASETGEFKFSWLDDDGSIYTASNKIEVA